MSFMDSSNSFQSTYIFPEEEQSLQKHFQHSLINSVPNHRQHQSKPSHTSSIMIGCESIKTAQGKPLIQNPFKPSSGQESCISRISESSNKQYKDEVLINQDSFNKTHETKSFNKLSQSFYQINQQVSIFYKHIVPFNLNDFSQSPNNLNGIKKSSIESQMEPNQANRKQLALQFINELTTFKNDIVMADQSFGKSQQKKFKQFMKRTSLLSQKNQFHSTINDQKQDQNLIPAPQKSILDFSMIDFKEEIQQISNILKPKNKINTELEITKNKCVHLFVSVWKLLSGLKLAFIRDKLQLNYQKLIILLLNVQSYENLSILNILSWLLEYLTEQKNDLKSLYETYKEIIQQIKNLNELDIIPLAEVTIKSIIKEIFLFQIKKKDNHGVQTYLSKQIQRIQWISDILFGKNGSNGLVEIFAFILISRDLISQEEQIISLNFLRQPQQLFTILQKAKLKIKQQSSMFICLSIKFQNNQSEDQLSHACKRLGQHQLSQGSSCLTVMTGPAFTRSNKWAAVFVTFWNGQLRQEDSFNEKSMKLVYFNVTNEKEHRI